MSAKTVEHHRLPDGGMTTDAEEYIKAWRDLDAPLAALMGWELYGFDPGISYYSAAPGGPSRGRVYEIPMPLVRKIAELHPLPEPPESIAIEGELKDA